MRRRPADLADGKTADEPRADRASDGPAPAGDSAEAVQPPRRKGYTPSKRERGITTPKRPRGPVRRTPEALQQRMKRLRGLSKEERRKLREERRRARQEVIEGMKRGDPRYLAPRDRGPERALVRDIVDSRPSIAGLFLVAALLVVLLSSTQVPLFIAAANALFITLALGLIVELVIIYRRIKRLVRERFPDSGMRMISLFTYALLRAFQLRRTRIPQPRVQRGDPV